jgi:hypothetical protein
MTELATALVSTMGSGTIALQTISDVVKFMDTAIKVGAPFTLELLKSEDKVTESIRDWCQTQDPQTMLYIEETKTQNLEGSIIGGSSSGLMGGITGSLLGVASAGTLSVLTSSGLIVLGSTMTILTGPVGLLIFILGGGLLGVTLGGTSGAIIGGFLGSKNKKKMVMFKKNNHEILCDFVTDKGLEEFLKKNVE